MNHYTAPIPPVQTPGTGPGPRVGGYDRFGVPQDTLHGRVHTPPTATVVPARRSVLLAVLLAAMLGPIGLLYSSRLGALVISTCFMLATLPVIPFWPEWIVVAAVPAFLVSIVWAFTATVFRNAAQAVHIRLTHLAQ